MIGQEKVANFFLPIANYVLCWDLYTNAAHVDLIDTCHVLMAIFFRLSFAKIEQFKTLRNIF